MLGTAVVPNAVSATVQGQGIAGNPATFNATATAGPAASINAVEGDGQTAGIGKAVAIRPRVRARDAFGNNVSNVGVNFAVTQGGGAVTGAAQTTAGDGTAAVSSWTLGGSPGTNAVSATAQGNNIAGNPVVFTATAAALLNVLQYVGTWTGTWINNTFASTGGNTVTITADTVAKTVTVAFSTSGPALGNPGGVALQSRMTTYDETGFTVTVTLNTYGTTTLTVNGEGQITASGVNIPDPAFVRWDATGTLTATQIVLDWTITFAGGSTASGRTTLAKQ
jgi:adhesin/invasin